MCSSDLAYQVDLSTATYTAPSGMGAILGSYIENKLLIDVLSVGSRTIDMRGALATTARRPTQDYCKASMEFPTGTFADPDFVVGPSDVVLDIGGYDVPVYDFTLTGSFSSDLLEFTDGTLSGLLDTSPLDPLVGSAGAICDLASSFGASCVSCPDGSESCLEVAAEDIVGADVPGLEVFEIAGADCDSCDTWTSSTVPAVADQVCPA